MNNNSQTLDQRLAEGKIPVREALRYAIQLGDALRQIHAQGLAHGAVTPSVVLLTSSGVRLLPSQTGVQDLTPYLAPEVIHGQAPDACTDVFGFGAVLYEMLTGQRAFAGDTPEAAAESVCNSHPAPIANPALERLISACLSKDHAARFQRMQQVLMELRLLAIAEHRMGAEAVLHRAECEAMLQAEAQHMESRWASRLEQTERSAAVEHSILLEACDALQAVRAQLCEMAGPLAAVQEGIARLDEAADAARAEMAEQRQAVTKIRNLEQTVHAQAIAIEMNAKSLVRIDDLVERVVEALESLQSLVLEHSDERVAVVKIA